MLLYGGAGGIGYNCAKVEELRDVINSTAKRAGEDITQILHDQIISPISKAWYAPEAQWYFQEFAKTVAASGEAITEAFDAFRQAVQEAGENWAENTSYEGFQAPKPVLSKIDTVVLNLEISEVLGATETGDVIIYEAQANNVAAHLGQTEKNIETALRGLASELDASSAFIGGGQAQALQTCFENVSGEIYKIFKFLTEGDTSLDSQIKAAVQKYKDVDGGIAGAFNSAQTGASGPAVGQ